MFRVVSGSKLHSLMLVRFEIPSPASLKNFCDVMEYNLVSGIIISQEHVAMFSSETIKSIYQTERRYVPQCPGMETVISADSRSLWLKKLKTDSWCHLKCTSYSLVEVYRRFKDTSAVGVLSCQTTRCHIPEPTHGKPRVYQTRTSSLSLSLSLDL